MTTLSSTNKQSVLAQMGGLRASVPNHQRASLSQYFLNDSSIFHSGKRSLSPRWLLQDTALYLATAEKGKASSSDQVWRLVHILPCFFSWTFMADIFNLAGAVGWGDKTPRTLFSSRRMSHTCRRTRLFHFQPRLLVLQMICSITSAHRKQLWIILCYISMKTCFLQYLCRAGIVRWCHRNEDLP